MLIRLFVFGFALMFLFISLGAPEARSQDEVITVTADQMLNDYKDNQLAGDQKYKGKKVKVSGTIANISSNHAGVPYVDFKTNQIMTSVQCLFSTEQMDGLLKLKKGEQFETICTVRGMGMMNLELEACTIGQ